jgi:hypothetical protein
MRFIDRALGLAVGVFFAGAFAGVLLVNLSSSARDFALLLLQARVVVPMRAVSGFGNVIVFTAIFLNNSVPVFLSFLYPFALGKINWTPPLTVRRRSIFLGSYTIITAFLTGLFSLGAPIGVASALGGLVVVTSFLSEARIHGPLELAFVLVCIAEPLRIIPSSEGDLVRRLREDRWLLPLSLAGLLASAAIEVFLRA